MRAERRTHRIRLLLLSVEGHIALIGDIVVIKISRHVLGYGDIVFLFLLGFMGFAKALDGEVVYYVSLRSIFIRQHFATVTVLIGPVSPPLAPEFFVI